MSKINDLQERMLQATIDTLKLKKHIEAFWPDPRLHEAVNSLIAQHRSMLTDMRRKKPTKRKTSKKK